MPNKEAWWVCSTCHKKVAKVGQRGTWLDNKFQQHVRECPNARCRIKQLLQGSKEYA